MISLLKEADVDATCRAFVTVFSSDETHEFAPSEIGAYIRPRRTAYKAFFDTYESNYIKGVLRRTMGKRRRMDLPLRLGIDEDKAKSVLREIAQGIDVSSIEARCKLLHDGGYRLYDERVGKHLHMGETVARLKESLDSGELSSPLIVRELPPKVFRRDLADNPPVHHLGRYTTRYGYHDDPNRIHNIRLVSKALNNHTILSGETFSFLDAIGEIGKDAGYKEALVIVGGELLPQYGGGACQVATTLYNAALFADMEIVKRRNHAMYFFIYPLGRDAAIYPGVIDFKFKNNTGHPVMVRSYATSSSMTVALYGTPTGKEVRFSRTKIIENKPGMFSYEISREAFSFDAPFTTIAERHVFYKGKLIKNEKIRSHYRQAGYIEPESIANKEDSGDDG